MKTNVEKELYVKQTAEKIVALFPQPAQHALTWGTSNNDIIRIARKIQKMKIKPVRINP